MKILPFATVLFATVSSAAFAASDMTQQFVTSASSSGMFEVESSKLALQRSKNAEVKKLASQMVADHTKANGQLKAALAKSDSGAKPAPRLLEQHADMLEELKQTDAEEFDAAYLDAQESAHEEAVTLFEAYAENGDDASVKQFASTTLPTLKAHKDHVESLDDKTIGDNL